MAKKNIRRGNIYFADLSPVQGSEQGGCRPVVVIQNDRGNAHSPTVVVALCTTALKREMPTHVWLNTSCGLNRDTMVLCEQIRTIDKSRLGSLSGIVPKEDMEKIDKALKISLGMA